MAGADELCAARFCVDVPQGWSVEVGEGYVSFSHPLDASVRGSVSTVNMRILVETAGGQWPTTTENAARAFWDVLGEGQSAALQTVSVGADGRVLSEGTLEGARLWHVLIPVGAGEAIGAEIRAPNGSWLAHADIVRLGLRVFADA